MKRWLAIGVISAYLGALSFGLGCHTLNAGLGSHPLMYFIVWDMFCGWASYASQMQIIAEGESQKYYEVSPGPWGELAPWGSWGRRHYDPLYNHGGRLAHNVLKHTSHEPITRMWVVEESWPKKFDLPDPIWRSRYGDQPKDVQKYCRIRAELLPCGSAIRLYTPWLSYQALKMVSSNPRLQAEAQAGRPMFLVESQRLGRDSVVTPGLNTGSGPLTSHSVGAPLGN